MRRVPLLSGSRVVVVPAVDDDLVLRPPAPPARIADTGAAARDALRFPLSGPPLEELARGARRVTIVVEPPRLPFPGASPDPRQDALAATVDELARAGAPDARQTLLVAGGLGRQLGRRALERLLPPPRARSFRGRVVVHDASSRELVTIAERGGQPVRSHRELVEADLVVVVTAAETVVDGGPGALVAASDAATVRATASTTSLLELSGSGSWDLVLAVEAALAEQVPLVGLSLVLDLPRAGGSLPGLDRDPEAGRSLGRIARAELRAAFSLLPGVARRAALDQRARSLAATAAFAGPPSVAHAEALLRGVELRGARLERPVDALVVGVPWFGPHLPRSPANPLTVAAAALGLALRLHRDAFPVRDGGTLVVLHPLRRSFQDVEQAPYGELYDAVRLARGASELEAAEAAAGSSGPALEAYRRGLACHPLQPFADWAACTPALSRLGRVVVAGCRDAIAARALGFVPARSVGSALEMAHGVAGGAARVGILVGPPYPPLIVGARE